MQKPDFAFSHQGSICILIPLNESARDWITAHISPEAMEWAGGIVIEPRYCDDIIAGLEDDGLIVEAA